MFEKCASLPIGFVLECNRVCGYKTKVELMTEDYLQDHSVLNDSFNVELKPFVRSF